MITLDDLKEIGTECLEAGLLLVEEENLERAVPTLCAAWGCGRYGDGLDLMMQAEDALTKLDPEKVGKRKEYGERIIENVLDLCGGDIEATLNPDGHEGYK